MRTTKKQRQWRMLHSVLLKLHRWYDAGLVNGGTEDGLVVDRVTEEIACLESAARSAMSRERERQTMAQLCSRRSREPRAMQVAPLEYPRDFPVGALDVLIEAHRRAIN